MNGLTSRNPDCLQDDYNVLALIDSSGRELVGSLVRWLVDFFSGGEKVLFYAKKRWKNVSVFRLFSVIL